MKEISVISQELDLGTLKFIRYCFLNKLKVKYLLIAPKVKKHPLRIKQEFIRTKIFANDFHWISIANITKYIKETKPIIFIKKLVLRSLLFFFKKKYCFLVECLEDDFISKNSKCYEHLTVLYSLEGLISQQAIKRFICGIINIHPAPLPDFRGLDAGLWALKEDFQVGVSAYLVNEGIDTGPIVNFYPLKNKGEDLSEYIKNLKELKRISYTDAVKRTFKKSFKTINPSIKKSQNRGLMPESTLKDLYKNFEK